MAASKSGKTIEKVPRRMFIDDARLRGKTADDKPADGPGFVEGYLSVWDNVDGEGDRMKKGAFVKSISERVAAGKVPLMIKHICNGGDVWETIGGVTEAKEDDYGLWFHAVYSSDPDAQKIRTRVNEGFIKSTSVGYQPIRWQNNTAMVDGESLEVTDFLECKLLDCTLTVNPANELAGVLAGKNRSESVASKNESASGGTAAAAPNAPAPIDLARLKRELTQRQAELEMLVL